LGDQVVLEGLRMVKNVTGEKRDIDIYRLFIAIGHKTKHTDIFKGQWKMTKTGYLITKVNYKNK